MFPSQCRLSSLNVEAHSENHGKQAVSDFTIYLEQAAASKRIFTLLGPLFVRSQCDDFSAVAGDLAADVTTSGIKNTFRKNKNKKHKTLKWIMWPNKSNRHKTGRALSLPILLLLVWSTSVSSAVCCLRRWRYLSAKYLKTEDSRAETSVWSTMRVSLAFIQLFQWLTLIHIKVLFHWSSIKSQLQSFGQSFCLLTATCGKKTS